MLIIYLYVVTLRDGKLQKKTREDAKIYMAMVIPALRMDQQREHY